MVAHLFIFCSDRERDKKNEAGRDRESIARSSRTYYSLSHLRLLLLCIVSTPAGSVLRSAASIAGEGSEASRRLDTIGMPRRGLMVIYFLLVLVRLRQRSAFIGSCALHIDRSARPSPVTCAEMQAQAPPFSTFAFFFIYINLVSGLARRCRIDILRTNGSHSWMMSD